MILGSRPVEGRFICGGTIPDMEHSAFGTFGRRLVAWIVLILVAVLALKVVFGIIAGIVTAILWSVLIVALVVAGIWALRRI